MVDFSQIKTGLRRKNKEETQELIPLRPLDVSLVGVAIVSILATYLPPFREAEALPTPLPMVLAWSFAYMITLGDPAIRENRSLGKILLLFLGIRFLLALAHYSHYWASAWEQYRLGLTGFDAYLYNDYAQILAAQGMSGEGPWENLNYSGIVYYYGILYSIFGYNPVFGVIANCLVSGLTPIPLYKFLLYFSSPRVAKWSAIGMAAWPMSILWSSLLMKESILTFLFVYGLYSGVLFVRRFHPIRAVMPLLCFFGLIHLRIVLGMILALSLGTFMMLRLRRRLGTLFVILGGSIVVLFILVRFAQVPLIERFGTPLSWEFYQTYAKTFRERPAELSAADPSTSLGILTGGAFIEGKFYWIPVRFLMYYFNPPPWASGYGIWDPFRMSSALLVYLAIPAVFFGFLRLWKTGGQAFYLIFPFFLGSLLISSTTPFLDDRLQMMMIPLFLGMAAWGWEDVSRWRQIYFLLPPVIAIGVFLYYLYKGGLS